MQLSPKSQTFLGLQTSDQITLTWNIVGNVIPDSWVTRINKTLCKLFILLNVKYLIYFAKTSETLPDVRNTFMNISITELV